MDTRGSIILSESGSAGQGTLRERVGRTMNSADTMEEGLAQVQAMLQREDANWRSVFAADGDDGLDLDELKKWSVEIRNAIIGAPWIGRGLRLRSSYIWQGGIKYGGVPGAKQGKGVNVQAFIDDPDNQRNFFNRQARRRRESCLYSDAIALWIGDNKTRKLRPVPLSEITGQVRDPDFASDIWAYRRTWEHFPQGGGPSETKHEWYFTDTFWDKRPKVGRGQRPTLPHEGNDEPFSQTHTAFDMHANAMEGFAYGSPDALAALIWSRIARDLVMDGVTMTSAMATFAFKATSTTKAGAEGASMKMAQPNGAGSTTVLGATNDLVPMSSAGKAYDFAALRDVVAIVATALDVSNTALTSNAGGAGSYNSESTLDLPTRLAMEARRYEHADLDERVLRWMGAKEAFAYFDSLDDASDIFREVQALLLLWSSGMYAPASLEKRLSELMSILDNKVPTNILIPNNSDSWERNDIDPKDAPGTAAVGKPNATAAGQGQASPVGKTDKAQDLRRDGVGEMVVRLQAFAESEEKLLAARAA